MKTILLKSILLLLAIFLFVIVGSAQGGDSPNKTVEKNEKQKKDQSLKITGKKPPSSSSFSKCFAAQGNGQLFIRLEVTFHSSGKISGAEIIESSGCEYFDKECLKVAHKIKFKPQVKGGEAVTVTKFIEYKAGIY